jgi:hypothetical protein
VILMARRILALGLPLVTLTRSNGGAVEERALKRDAEGVASSARELLETRASTQVVARTARAPATRTAAERDPMS